MSMARRDDLVDLVTAGHNSLTSVACHADRCNNQPMVALLTVLLALVVIIVLAMKSRRVVVELTPVHC